MAREEDDGWDRARERERTLELRRQLREEIRRDQEDLRSVIRQVGTSARETVSLKRMVRGRPLPWIAGAFALGFVLGYRA